MPRTFTGALVRYRRSRTTTIKIRTATAIHHAGIRTLVIQEATNVIISDVGGGNELVSSERGNAIRGFSCLYPTKQSETVAKHFFRDCKGITDDLGVYCGILRNVR